MKCVKIGLITCTFLLLALSFYFIGENVKITLQGPTISGPVMGKLPEKLSEELSESSPVQHEELHQKIPEEASGDKSKPAPAARPKKPIADKRSVNSKLPQSVIDGIKTFVFFVGHGSSGHSIVGSLLDSHPHMVISHEFALFQKLSTGSLAPTKPAIFNALWNYDRRNSQWFEVNSVKGYTLMVDGLYEGKYIDHIDVIGDKRGDLTIRLFIDHPSNWLKVYKILLSLNVTLKVIHVIRNPYDNIASMVFLSDRAKYSTFKNIKRANETYTFDSNYTAKLIEKYFQNHQAIVSVKEKCNLDIIEVHGKDLISDPKGTLLRICDQLGVTCSDNYLEVCSKKIFKTESRTRHLLKWTEEQLELIQQNIDKYSCLKGYTFDSI